MTYRPRRFTRPASLIAAALLLFSVLSAGFAPVRAQQADGVTTLTGNLAITNPLILDNASQPYVLLADMTAYIARDRELPLPLGSQIIAPFEGNLAEGAGFALDLPIAPQGTINDVDHGEGEGNGVQIYSVEFASNVFGDPFLDETEFTGWGEALSSLIVTPGDNEVIGGAVVVWAPDDQQLFPTGFGADGLFLTGDDPVGPIPAGWTVVDLNSAEFAQARTPEVEITIEEGDDGFTDLTQLRFTEAFTALIDELELRYPFTEEKGIDWAALRQEYLPRVEEAEAADDPVVFSEAIVDFSVEFNDGHVAASFTDEIIAERIGGRLGMRLAETESGDVIVISVTEGLPADEAGIELGAVITEWNGQPTLVAVEDEPLLFGASTDFSIRLQQYEFLTRGPVGDLVSVTFTNEGGEAQTVELTFAEDIEGRDVAANIEVSLGDFDPAQLPVDASLLDSGIGLIRINTFLADPIQMATAWDAALTNLTAAGAIGLILDVRDNGGGFGPTSLYFAGSFYDEPFELYRNEYINEEGVSIDIGGDEVTPSPVRWEAPVAVIIDDGCFSACEIFAAAMAEDPEHLIVGYTPTAGVEASVYFWALPGDVSFQASIGRLERDGELFLEGVGVPPNVEVPSTEENLLNPGDEVLAIAEESLFPLIEAYFAEIAAEAAATPEGSPVAATPEASPVGEATPAA